MLSRSSRLFTNKKAMAQFVQATRASSSIPRGFHEEKLSYTEKQDLTGRPVSPHVTIYKFPITALTSITNRATGVGLFAGLAGVSLLSFVPGVDPSAVMNFIGNSCMGSVAKMAVAFPLTYHYINGMRHFYWDRTPDALTNDQVENTSYAVFLSSFFTSLFITVL